MPNPTQTDERDGNSIVARMAVLNTDTEQGQNLVTIAVSNLGYLKINSSSTINFTMVPVDPRDQNYATCWLFKGLDGLLYPAVADAAGSLLIEM